MERAAALKKLGKLLGKSMTWRIDDKAPTGDERADAQAALKVALDKSIALHDQRNARLRAILAADTEYQTLFAAHKAASEHADQLQAAVSRYKITVGIDHGGFNFIEARGDSWEEIIEKLTEKQKAAA